MDEKCDRRVSGPSESEYAAISEVGEDETKLEHPKLSEKKWHAHDLLDEILGAASPSRAEEGESYESPRSDRQRELPTSVGSQPISQDAAYCDVDEDQLNSKIVELKRLKRREFSSIKPDDKGSLKSLVLISALALAALSVTFGISTATLGVASAAFDKLTDDAECFNPCGLGKSMLRSEGPYNWAIVTAQTDNSGCLLLLAARCTYGGDAKALLTNVEKDVNKVSVSVLDKNVDKHAVSRSSYTAETGASVNIIILCDREYVRVTYLADGRTETHKDAVLTCPPQ